LLSCLQLRCSCSPLFLLNTITTSNACTIHGNHFIRMLQKKAILSIW
jgi:hypothetical protein